MLARTALIGIVALSAIAAADPCRADVDPNSGIDLVRIGSPGNAPWMGNGTVGDSAIGRGSVSYVYSIGRMEVTTFQWAEFMNAAFDRPAADRLNIVSPPAVWGAVAAAPTNAGGLRWTVPTGKELIPVGGISWHTAAMYCNWLCNAKSSASSAFLNGAYDVSTFRTLPNGFADQLTHNAEAQYWIPTWDEMLKASHFDPNRFGASQPGYWTANNTLGHLAVSGPPGTGEANFGFVSPSPFSIPLGSYPNVQSPWGLLDTAGGTAEWTEYVFTSGSNAIARGAEGSRWASDLNGRVGDTIYTLGLGDSPGYAGYEVGFRVASSVPSPLSCMVFPAACAFTFARSSRRAASRRRGPANQ